ncbi:MAG: hypothetical protein WCR06_02595 [bacterium]
MRFLDKVLVITQTMIEEIPLPAQVKSFGDVLFPLENDLAHRLLLRKRNQHVQMVWHQY